MTRGVDRAYSAKGRGVILRRSMESAFGKSGGLGLSSAPRHAVLAVMALAMPLPASGSPDFQGEIRPILQRCLPCHGPDEHSRQGNLRLDSFRSATGRDGGHAGIVPGNSAASRVIARVTSESMPMPPTGERLSLAEIEALGAWIDSGAGYERHWAYDRPARPSLPDVSKPGWPRNPIDSFVLAKLDEHGLGPSGEADRATLARRLSLDLTGLPPDPARVEEFVRDSSGHAHERFVDSLMASPAFGERWASVWLDLARYADSMGYEKDTLRTIWPYRDWVVKAINENLPFDRFTELQLAGDLLPEPSRDALVATGFHRNTMTNTEGGTDDEEFRDAAVKDRVATTGQVWMGQTWGCAQCHSHKYDPLSHSEYYSLYAFFNQTADADRNDDSPQLDLGAGISTPVLRELASDERRETFVHRSGNFRNPGEPVAAAVPASMHPMSPGAPENRLGLARWITSDRNPLTARVLANRLWARLFGVGIVETEEDFGTQGELPTHPRLLDWLAVELVDGGWNVKATLRKIVSSATYRQSSELNPQALQSDPTGALLSRAPSFRWPAETIRDQALAASGLLSLKVGGPPVMPWQPAGVWQVVYSTKQWEPSPGEDRYRRAIYTLWRRTAPYPSMTTFDAPSGETCTLRRIRTSTPLQALVTLNDPTLMEAAQHLAVRSARESEGSDEARLERIFRLVLARPPHARERERLLKLLDTAAEDLQRDPQGAGRLARFDAVLYEKDRRETFVPDSRTEAATWQYVVASPPAGWSAADFDDSQWASGQGGFGSSPRPEDDSDSDKDGDHRTAWDSAELWLRTDFDLAGENWSGVQVVARNSGSFTAYLNGVPVADDEYGSGEHTPHAADPVAAATLRRGRNVLAVHAVHTGLSDARRHIDVGLTGLRPPALPDDPLEAVRDAAWVALANVVLNMDETLTRR